MAVLYGEQGTLLNAGTTLAPGMYNGTVRVLNEEITLASQGTGDTIVIGTLPKGAIPLFGVMNNSASLGSSTVAARAAGPASSGRPRSTAHARSSRSRTAASTARPS